jgi:phosphotransferase system HPr (HPr) family protein
MAKNIDYYKIYGEGNNLYTQVKIENKFGLHARPAALIIKSTKDRDCDINLHFGENHVSGKSMLGVMTLGAPYGSDLILRANGIDARACLEDLINVFKNKFNED